MKTYKLKLTALSPIHIGTGEDYEPTNYVIDSLKDGTIEEKDYLFEFNEMTFYANLDAAKKQEFNKIVSDDSYNARFKIYDFIFKNKDVAKKIAFRRVLALPETAKEYKEKIGKVVQKEGGRKNVFNEFKIAKIYISPNKNRPVLPGSSLKGSISTAYQEFLYKKLRDYNAVYERMLKPTEDNLFKNFVISDSIPIKTGSFIGYAVNIKRDKETRSEMKTRLEAITPTSEFEVKLDLKDKLNINEIIQACNNHYLPLFKSQFDYKTDGYTRRKIHDSFIKKYENWQPQNNQFIIRVGKHSGARAVTVDGIRNIKIMQGKNKSPKFDKEETTVWLRDGNGILLPFGWLLCEIL